MSYICQSCKIPLVLDESLEELSHAQKHLLTTTYGGNPNQTDHTSDDLVDQYPTIPGDRLEMFKKVINSNDKPQVDSSFVLLDKKPSEHQPQSLSGKLESLDKIFNIISSRYEIDYPVCTDCANVLISQMQIKMDTLAKENDTYSQFIKRLSAQVDPEEDQVKETLEELEELKTKENEVLQLLKKEEGVHSDLVAQISEVEQELKALKTQEEQCCVKRNIYEMDIVNQFNKLEKAKSKYYQNLDILDSLRNSNVFDTLFEISYKGEFGTINGLRLGSLPEANVSWHEINAALGQIILLMSTCLNILQIDLDEYKLIPMGSTSRIECEKIDSNGDLVKTVLKLYTTGEFSIAGFLKHNNLDRGMAGLLDVVRQISVHLKALDSRNEIPYPISGDKIGSISIRPSSRSKWETWTMACKFLLVDVNWIKTFTVAQYYCSGA